MKSEKTYSNTNLERNLTMNIFDAVISDQENSDLLSSP